MPANPDDVARTLKSGGGKSSRTKWIVALAIVVAAAAAWYVFASGSDSSSVRYQSEAVTRGMLTVTVAATGTVQPTTQVDISSELSGMIAEVAVEHNDLVEAGTVLARLDTTKLEAQVANAKASLAASGARLEQAKGSLAEAQTKYDSAKRLDATGYATRNEFVSAQVALERAKADLAIAEADQSLAQANLALQEADLEKAVIRSPIRGIVLNKDADAGQIVAASFSAPTLFTIAEDLTRMELRVDVDEADIGRVAVGNEATFTVDAYSDKRFPAVITSVRYAPETTDGVVTYKAVLSVDNSELALRPGMTATATIVVRKLDDVLMVPNAALRYVPPQTVTDTGGGSGGGGLLGLLMPRRPESSVAENRDGGKSVWVLRDGAPAQVSVTAGESDGRMTEVQSDELQEGARVITDQSGGA
ncbi:MAG: efflux RND transporter periplasmic adaptor subunit [Brucellaceae bacterium]|nr:efflux RND transporter periplasmic adaptor subunit [Brucellaceae bacterium]